MESTEISDFGINFCHFHSLRSISKYKTPQNEVKIVESVYIYDCNFLHPPIFPPKNTKNVDLFEKCCELPKEIIFYFSLQ